MQSQKWVFTLNNYTDDELALVRLVGGDLARYDIRYLVFGREVGAGGTPHLQGFVVFNHKKRRNGVLDIIGRRCFVEPSRARGTEAADYCKKEGDYDEFGSYTPGVSKPTAIARYCAWLKTLDSFPSDRTIANEFPELWIRYQSRLVDLAAHICPLPPLVEGELRDWQVTLLEELEREADDRKVKFVVDETGGLGKSWFCRWLLQTRSDVQILGTGKVEDISYAIDITKKIYCMNVPRGGMEYLQYRVLEMMKDRVVFSSKYYSQTKILRNRCHVVVFCNEPPDYSKMTDDRYDVLTL